MVKYSNLAVCHTATGTHMPYGITQCYLPPGRGDIPAFTSAKADTQFNNPRWMQGWVDLGTVTAVTVCSPCTRDCMGSGHCDKHDCPPWDSNLGPLTPQSDMLTTRPLLYTFNNQWEYPNDTLFMFSLQLSTFSRGLFKFSAGWLLYISFVSYSQNKNVSKNKILWIQVIGGNWCSKNYDFCSIFNYPLLWKKCL